MFFSFFKFNLRRYVAVLLDGACRIGDHIVSKNHHHALPLYVVDFKRTLERQTEAAKLMS